MPAGSAGARELLRRFPRRASTATTRARDFPAVKGPSYLGVHLRFGTVSIRAAGARAPGTRARGRLARRRGVAVGADLARLLPPDPAPPSARRRASAFRPEYDAHQVGARQARRRAVRRLVRRPHRLSAGRRGDGADQPDRLHAQPAAHGGGELPGARTSGIDWRRGEAYFATQLNDFDLAANNGGWQWASVARAATRSRTSASSTR